MNIGDQVGQYRVTQLLGEGGMGAVYKAIDTLIEREVAIKVLRPEIGRNANLLQRFRAEAITVAKLNHAGIATLYSFQQNGDEFLMIMEYVPGKTLEAIERERGALPLELAIPLFTKILEAIGPAHESGILHRDIKPANIMLTTWGAIKVMDFGIARIAGAARQTRDGALVGTMEYIAPERVKGSEGDIRSDIYALGVVLFEMLSGRLPFNSSNEFELMRMHLEVAVPTFASQGLAIPPTIEALIQRAMAKKPEDRFATCEDFAEAVHQATGDLKVSRGDIVALVGKPVVQELGTAGHHSSISAETLTPAAVPPGYTPPAATSQPSGAYSPVARASASAAPQKPAFQRYRIPIFATAALAVAVGAGVGVGKLVHHGASAPPVNGTTQSQPANDPSSPVQGNVGGSLPLVPTPSAQTIEAVPANPIPVQETPATPKEPKPDRNAAKARRERDQLHQKALKALDE